MSSIAIPVVHDCINTREVVMAIATSSRATFSKKLSLGAPSDGSEGAGVSAAAAATALRRAPAQANQHEQVVLELRVKERVQHSVDEAA